MSTLTCVRAFLRCILLPLAFGACTPNNTDPALDKLSKNQSGHHLAEAYSSAVKKATQSNPTGFIEIYQIAAHSNSAEIGEVARDKICELLYTQPVLWITTYSSIDFEEFKAYLQTGGLAPIDLPKGIRNHREFAVGIKQKLKRDDWNKTQKDLADTVVSILEIYLTSHDE